MMDLKVKQNILVDAIQETLKTIYDPEIPVNLWELGLIYEVRVDDDFNAYILMTLTTPNCPVAESLPTEVKEKIQGIRGINEVNLELTFEPPWDSEMLSEEAKLELGML
jgi:FeS assembly SUF system protein